MTQWCYCQHGAEDHEPEYGPCNWKEPTATGWTNCLCWAYVDEGMVKLKIEQLLFRLRLGMEVNLETPGRERENEED